MNDLELGYELRDLPAVPAPRTLLPRVLLAVADLEDARWYSRAWVTWPRGLQVASVVLLVVSVAGVWRLVSGGPAWIPAPAASTLKAAFAPLEPAARVAEQASTLGRVWWQVWLQPVAMYFLALLVACSLVCGALWTAVNRVALGGASSQ